MVGRVEVVAAQAPFQFRSRADLVVVHAAVFSDGEPALDLTAEDFVIRDNGVERPVSVLLAPRSAPLEVALVLDVSGSMNHWLTREAALEFLDNLPLGACVLLVPFQEQVLPSAWGHPNDTLLRDMIGAFRLDGATALYDALLAAFSVMRERAASDGRWDPGVAASAGAPGWGELMRFRLGSRLAWNGDRTTPRGECKVMQGDGNPLAGRNGVRRAIAVVTDGLNTYSDSSASWADVMLAAWGSNLPVYALTPRPQNRWTGDTSKITGDVADSYRPRSIGVAGRLNAFRRLAEFTGGASFGVAPQTAGAQEGFLALSGALTAEYVLGYLPETSVDGDPPLLDRHRVEVSIARPGYEVTMQSDLVRGVGASEGAAMQAVMSGAQEITMGQSEAAVLTFQAAVSLAPQLGVAHYGLGIALAMEGRAQGALAAFRQTAAKAPWIPDLDARHAELLIDTGELDEAWVHALRAYAAGSEVSALFDRLQALAPRDLTLVDPGAKARVFVQATGSGGLAAQLVVPRILAALALAINESPAMVFTSNAEARDFTLYLDVDGTQEQGPRVSLRGWLVLRDREHGKDRAKIPFNLDDAGSSEEVGEAVAAAMIEVGVALQEHLRKVQ